MVQLSGRMRCPPWRAIANTAPPAVEKSSLRQGPRGLQHRREMIVREFIVRVEELDPRSARNGQACVAGRARAGILLPDQRDSAIFGSMAFNRRCGSID